MTFTLAQRILDSFPFRYVHGCAEDFSDSARGIHHRVRNVVKVFYLPIWDNDSKISLRLSPVRLCGLHFLLLLKAGSVVGVNSIDNDGPIGLHFHGVDLENAKG